MEKEASSRAPCINNEGPPYAAPFSPLPLFFPFITKIYYIHCTKQTFEALLFSYYYSASLGMNYRKISLRTSPLISSIDAPSVRVSARAASRELLLPRPASPLGSSHRRLEEGTFAASGRPARNSSLAALLYLNARLFASERTAAGARFRAHALCSENRRRTRRTRRTRRSRRQH